MKFLCKDIQKFEPQTNTGTHTDSTNHYLSARVGGNEFLPDYNGCGTLLLSLTIAYNRYLTLIKQVISFLSSFMTPNFADNMPINYAYNSH